jgi:hypothetical protein
MLTFNVQIMEKFKELANDVIRQERENLSTGAAKRKGYHRACGKIQGLRDAIDLIDEALRQCEGKERSK